MTAPRAPGADAARWRLAGIGLLGMGVAAAVHIAGRLAQPDYAFSMFGANPVPPKSLLATIVLGLAVLQVVLALWMYRKLPLAGRPPRPVPVAHRVTGFALFALTVPVAVHCLIAYGVQLTSWRVAVHSITGCLFYGAFTAKDLEGVRVAFGHDLHGHVQGQLPGGVSGVSPHQADHGAGTVQIP